MAPVAWPAILASCLLGDEEQEEKLLDQPAREVERGGNGGELNQGREMGRGGGKAYEVWVSLLPLHMTTSAGLVLVCLAF